MYFCYTKLNFVIFDSDVVILGLDLLIFGSNSVCHAITTVDTGWVCLVGTPRPKGAAVKVLDFMFWIEISSRFVKVHATGKTLFKAFFLTVNVEHFSIKNVSPFFLVV